ncbi:S8 family serine peptidase, partial [bacterium]|nr:S8 family serine peptidase [bacterium]
MKLRVLITLTAVMVLLLCGGCSQEELTPTTPRSDADGISTIVRAPEVNLAEMGKAADEAVAGRYIIQFTGDVADVRDRARALADKYGFETGYVYEHAIKGLPARIPDTVADRIRQEAGVLRVTQDRRARVLAQSLPTGIDRIETDLNPIANIDGNPDNVDVDIAVIDTGIDYNHPDLNVVGGIRILGGISHPDFMDDYGHGTHVAGTAAAIDNDLGVVGVAPGARLWGVKVLDSSGSGSYSDIIAGLDWVTARAAEIEIVNMSLGGLGWDPAFHDAVAACVNAGVVVVVAAGNSGMDVYGFDRTIGNWDDTVPAAFPEAAAISALADSDGMPGGSGPATSSGPDDSFATFSNSSRAVYAGNPVTSPGLAIDLILPGVDIVSTIPGGGYYPASGTSMASPHAAGLAALFIAEHGRAGDGAGVYAIRQALIDAGMPQGGPGGLATLNDPDGNREPLGWAAPAGGAADVAFTNFTGETEVMGGDILHLDVTIANLGDLDATGPFDAWIGVQGSSFELARKTLPLLPSGVSRSVTINFIVPAADLAAAVPPGTYTLFVTHDFSDANPGNDLMTHDVTLLGGVDTGTIVINPDPDALNAPWTLTGPGGSPTAGTGDATLTDMAVGDYSIEWGAVAGYVAPANAALTLTGGATITFAGTYTLIPTTGTVVINPDPDAINAPWSVIGPDKIEYTGNGDDTLADVPAGDYTVAWGAVAGYLAPAGETLTLAADATITFNGVYTEVSMTGTVAVDAEPNALNAPWTITGPVGTVNGTGDASQSGLPIGDYTIAWGEVAGWIAPAGETLTLVADATITFQGVYTQIPT